MRSCHGCDPGCLSFLELKIDTQLVFPTPSHCNPPAKFEHRPWLTRTQFGTIAYLLHSPDRNSALWMSWTWTTSWVCPSQCGASHLCGEGNESLSLSGNKEMQEDALFPPLHPSLMPHFHRKGKPKNGNKMESLCAGLETDIRVGSRYAVA